MKLGNAVVLGAVLTALFALNIMTISLLLETDGYVYRLHVRNAQLAARVKECKRQLAAKARTLDGPRQAGTRTTPTRHEPASQRPALRTEGA